MGGPHEEINAEMLQRFEAAEHLAFEQHVLALVKAFAEIEEEGNLEIRGRPMELTLVEAELVGSYPKTLVKTKMLDTHSGAELVGKATIWQDLHRKPDESMRSPAYIAGEIVRLAREG